MERKYKNKTGFAQIIDDAIARCPDREAIVFGDWRITYREFGVLINRTANMLRDRGIGKGSRIAIISRNCPEFLIAEFAALQIGAVPVKINWRLTPKEMIYLLDENKVSFGFLKAENPEWGDAIVGHYAGKIDFLRLEPEDGGAAFCSITQAYSDEKVDVLIEREDSAICIQTSGTTGRPKSVQYTHGGMLDEIEAVKDIYAYYDGQRYQFVAQLFHSAAIGAHLCLSTGGTLVLMSQFKIDTYMKSLLDEKICAISVVPTVLKWILDEMDRNHYDLSSIKVVRYSTCAIPPVLLERALKRLDCAFYQSYGMTEMGSVITTLSAEEHFSDNGAHLTTVGRPIPGAKLKIVREDGTECEKNETGEILAKGPGCMKEYFGQPELTRKAFVDGWYRTKDMGYLDEQGYLHLSGRADDLIISGGENIYPCEIINVIMQLIDDVSEVAVYGVPDNTWGEHVKASVVLRPGSKLTEEDLLAYCREHMPSFRIPKEIEFLGELPKNATGKVLVSELKNRKQ